MDTTYIPGPYDANMAMEGAGVTKTADYDGATLDLGSGYAPGGIGQPAAVVADVSALDTTDGDETYAFTVQESADGGVTWTDAGPAVTVTAAGAVSVPCFISGSNLRLSLNVGGTTPSVTYTAHMVPLGFVG